MAFQPETKDELQAAVDLWIVDSTTTIETYGPINSWDVSLITDMRGLFRETTFNDDKSGSE